MYKLQEFQGITQILDLEKDLVIPMDEGNSDYQQYLKWLEKGNTPEPANPVLPIPDGQHFRLALRNQDSWNTWQRAVLKVNEIALLDLRDLALNDRWEDAQAVYDSLKQQASPTPQARQQWQAIADRYHVIFQF